MIRERGRELENSYFPWFCSTFNTLGILPRSYTTMVPPLFYRVFSGFACHLQSLRSPYSTLYLLQPYEFLTFAYNNTFQHAGDNLLVYSFSHHQGMVVTFLSQLVAWCSKGYPWATPLLDVLKKMQRYHSKNYPTYITCLTLPSTFNTITMQQK